MAKARFDDVPVFRPLMLANPIEERDLGMIDLDAFAVEWKWDGIRAQIAARFDLKSGADVRLYSRSGDNISAAFPDIINLWANRCMMEGIFDGELLIKHANTQTSDDKGNIAGFEQLQRRLNGKTVSVAMIKRYPAFIRLYDVLFDGKEDLRPLPFYERRARLLAKAQAVPEHGRNLFDISDLIEASSLQALDELRRSCRGERKEGLMLKRKNSIYQAGRPRGEWFKWKRDPLNLDRVLMYAQRGHGRRSSFYSDYTFGAWLKGDGDWRLVPVGKAYSGFTDEELTRLDKWVRNNTVKHFGPVCEVHSGLVFEIGFDSAHRSTRHKSGVAMRFPRILRIRWDKPFRDADRLSTLEAMIER